MLRIDTCQGGDSSWAGQRERLSNDAVSGGASAESMGMSGDDPAELSHIGVRWAGLHLHIQQALHEFSVSSRKGLPGLFSRKQNQ